MGRVFASGSRGDRRRPRPHFRAVSPSEGTPATGRRNVFGRRAADGRDRARPDGAATRAVDGRALDGLAPLVVEQVFETIQSINAAGTTILLVEQTALMALEIADHAYVMEHGEIVLEGAGPALTRDERVISIYLG